jgi:hypothetical protein
MTTDHSEAPASLAWSGGTPPSSTQLLNQHTLPASLSAIVTGLTDDKQSGGGLGMFMGEHYTSAGPPIEPETANLAPEGDNDDDAEEDNSRDNNTVPVVCQAVVDKEDKDTGRNVQ